MKKIVALLLVVTALAVAAPSFAQNHGANNHENELTLREYGKIFKSLGEGFCEIGKWIGKKMDTCMKGFGQGGYIGPHNPSAIDSQNSQKIAPVKKKESQPQQKQEAKPQQKKETPKAQKSGNMGTARPSKTSASGKAYLKNQIKRKLAQRDIA